MANTSAVYARIDKNLKDHAEGILAQLGITPSSAIQMFYSQVVLISSPLTGGWKLRIRSRSSKSFSFWRTN